MNRSQAKKCTQIAEVYGSRAQEQQAVSKLTELQYVLTRRPSQRECGWHDQLIDEIADVLIMIEQLKALHRIADEAVSGMIDYKLQRQLDRISKGDRK